MPNIQSIGRTKKNRMTALNRSVKVLCHSGHSISKDVSRATELLRFLENILSVFQVDSSVLKDWWGCEVLSGRFVAHIAQQPMGNRLRCGNTPTEEATGRL